MTPLLAQDRIEDLRAVDVLDDDRPTLSGHAPREPTVDRDPDAPLGFLLEPDSSSGDELVPVVVMEEDRCCVRLEGFADSRQQFAEQLVELEVRERGVGNHLKSLKTLGVTVQGHGRRIGGGGAVA